MLFFILVDAPSGRVAMLVRGRVAIAINGCTNVSQRRVTLSDRANRIISFVPESISIGYGVGTREDYLVQL